MLRDLKFINFPSSKPDNWPFDTWMSPEEWETINPTDAWGSFFVLDVTIEVWLKQKILPTNSIAFGFVMDNKSPARIVLKNGTAFIGLDWRILMHCVIIGAYYNRGQTIDLTGMKPDSTISDFTKGWNKAIKLIDRKKVGDVLRPAGVFVDFIISHELNHLISGHFDIIRDYVRKKRTCKGNGVLR